MEASGRKRLGRYVLTERIASGGMAELFLGRFEGQRGFSKQVVVKRILSHFCADPDFVAMFIDEACIAARLCHPNIVQIYDFGSVDGVYFISMEYVPGFDLRSALALLERRGESLSLVEVAAIGEGIARGLYHAHSSLDERGRPLEVVHRDVTPHNIMLSKTGSAKLADFGIAKARDRVAHTQTGAIKGKAAYMAPEQAIGATVDARTDQYALGIVLWECLVSRRLFSGGSPLAVLHRVAEGSVPLLRDAAHDIPLALANVVDRMLAKRPADRYSTMEDVRAALSEFLLSRDEFTGRELEDLVGRLGQVPLVGNLKKDSHGKALLLSEPQEQTKLVEGGRDTVKLGSVTVSRGLSGSTQRAAWTTSYVASCASVVSIPRKRLFTKLLVAGVLVCGAVGLGARGRGEHVNLGKPDASMQVRRELSVYSRPEEPKAQALLSNHERIAEVSNALQAQQSGAEFGLEKRPRTQKKKIVSRSRINRPRKNGKLFLRTTNGWATVALNGKVLGTTPLTDVSVLPGTHELLLTYGPKGQKRKIVVEISEGEAVKRTVRLP